jgi:hypothetical protein
MGGIVPHGSEPVDAGLGPGVTITGAGAAGSTGGQQRRRRQQNGRILGLTGDQWIAISAMLNAAVLAATLAAGVIAYAV